MHRGARGGWLAREARREEEKALSFFLFFLSFRKKGSGDSLEKRKGGARRFCPSTITACFIFLWSILLCATSILMPDDEHYTLCMFGDSGIAFCWYLMPVIDFISLALF